MLQRRIYYTVKPFVPWRVRMAVRRLVARRARKQASQVWPIDETAGSTPAGWPGWPEGKRFAFVLTHDVEGPEGVAACRALAELEMSLGVRSSFNFIPEGPYSVSPELRSWLTENGFEVGVHDLHHDGRLFNSREGFRQKAPRINRYLREWNASGFRAGFMLRNLDWFHDLDVVYDASSFDTDPFEPQADGAHTIFPFWIPRPPGAALSSRDRPGYVELPYTLPQDSTLYLLFREKSPVIWIRKLDWLAERGGMVLLNVHPDYVNFADRTDNPRQFPIRHYRDFLQYLLGKYQGQFWHPLPIELARWYRANIHPAQVPAGTTATPVAALERSESVARPERASQESPSAGFGGRRSVGAATEEDGCDGAQPSDRKPFSTRTETTLSQSSSAATSTQKTPHHGNTGFAPIPTAPQIQPAPSASALAALKGKRVGVLLYSNYPADPRPRRAAEAMIDAGMEVDLLCLSESDTDSRTETINGVRVTRLPMQRKRDGKWTYLWQYSRFIAAGFWFLATRSLRHRYDLVHVHNMPDVLVFGALVPKLQGAKVILDLHDPMPELMMTIFGAREDGRQIKLLRFLERCSTGFADTVLTVNEACRRIFSRRSCPAEKVGVVMNSPDEGIFAFREPGPTPTDTPAPRPFVIMYHGSIVERHGLDLAVDALRMILPEIPHAQLRVYGHRTPFLDRVLDSIKDTPLATAVTYHGPKKLEAVVQAIRESDVGVIPNRRNIFTELNTPTRIFEYLSLGKPIIAPKAPGILDYFGPEDLVYFELGDAADLAEKLAFVHREPDRVREIVHRGQQVYRQHCWSSERNHFLSLVARTLGSSHG